MGHALRDAKVLVVGASSGIGLAIAEEAVARGARVAVAARRIELLDEVAGRTGMVPIKADIRDPESCTNCVRHAVGVLGGLDVLVIASAIMPVAGIKELRPEDWAQTFAVNVAGPSLLLTAAADALGRDGLTVVLSSQGVGEPRSGLAAYSASKAALDETVVSWRVEHPELRVVRLIIGPTYTKGLIENLTPEQQERWITEWADRGQIPAIVASPQDVAAHAVVTIESLLKNTTAFVDAVRIIPRPTDQARAVG